MKVTMKNIIPIIALVVSVIGLYYTYSVDKRTRYDQTPSFNIVQNLWNPTQPSFTLVNESTKKLAQPPYHTYLMLIPNKLMFQDKKTNTACSILVLTPVSYQAIIEQKDSFKTVGDIETSILPKSFYGKKGERDIISSPVSEKLRGLDVKVITYPMLVIYCEGHYRYSGEDQWHTIRFLSTPIDKIDITKKDSDYLKQYIDDNSNLEIKPVKDKSVYIKANQLVRRKFNALPKEKGDKKGSFMGATEGGYGYILKKINPLITPKDPIAFK